jgi:hypothetical protein
MLNFQSMPKANVPSQAKATTTTTPAASQTKEYPFFEPFVYPPTWNAEMADIDRNYALLSSEKNDSLGKLAADTTQPILFIGKPVYEGIMEMAKYAASKRIEAAAYFLYKPLNQFTPHWEAFGWFMTGQTASGAEVEMEGSDFGRYRMYLKEKYPELMMSTLFGHSHVHPNMGTFWSGTDKKQQYDKSQLATLTGHRLFLVVNEKKDILGKYIQYTPVTLEIDKITLGISFNNPEYINYNLSDDKEMIHKMVDELVEKKYAGVVTYGNWWGNSNRGKYNPDTGKWENGNVDNKASNVWGNTYENNQKIIDASPIVHGEHDDYQLPDDITADWPTWDMDEDSLVQLMDKIAAVADEKENPLIAHVVSTEKAEFNSLVAYLVVELNGFFLDNFLDRVTNFDPQAYAAYTKENRVYVDRYTTFMSPMDKNMSDNLVLLYNLFELGLTSEDEYGGSMLEGLYQYHDLTECLRDIGEVILELCALVIFLKDYSKDAEKYIYTDIERVDNLVEKAYQCNFTKVGFDAKQLMALIDVVNGKADDDFHSIAYLFGFEFEDVIEAFIA